MRPRRFLLSSPSLPFLPRACFTLSAAAFLCGGAQAQNLVTLHQAASSYDSAYQSARFQRDAAISRSDQARAGLLPSAGLSGQAGYAQTRINATGAPPADRNGASQSLGINASQPLYRPANSISFEQSKRAIDIAQLQLDAASQELLVRVSQAYFDVLAGQDTLAFVRAQKTAVVEQLAFAKRNFEVGTSTITDTREAQARYDLVVAQEIAADNDLRVKRLALDQLVGKDNVEPRPLALPVQLPPVQPDTVARWVQTSEDNQPAVRQALVALRVARLETDKAKTGHLPTVDLTAGYNIARNPIGAAVPAGVSYRTNSTSVGVTLNLPLFAGFAVQNRVRETLMLEQKAEADLETARRTVAQATRTAFFGVISGQGQVAALEAAEASSQSALDANKLGYQVGVRINIDVLNAQSQLYQTKRDLAQARYNVLLGQLKLRQAVGILTADDLQPVNALLAP